VAQNTPVNVLVDVPCNSSGNAEVVQTYDAARGNLYEAWIGCGGIGFSRSTDGGATFEPALTVPGSTPPLGSSWDPSIALAPNGTIYVGFMVDVPGDAPVVAWSWDEGQTFAGFAYAFTPSPNEFSDRDFLAVAPNGTLYLTWDYSPNASQDVIGCASGGSCYFTNGDYNIVCAWSTDGGSNWSAPVPVNPEYPAGGAPAGPLLVEPGGSIDVLYEDYNVTGPTHALGVGSNYFTRSIDGGRTWSPPVRVSNGSFPNTVWWINGALARDPTGTLYATFDTQDPTSDTAWVATSVDGGASWTSVRVNPDVDSAAHLMVTAAMGESGSAYVAWLSNNSSAGWSAYEVPVGGNGSFLGPITLVSESFGVPGYWIGDTLGISYLGQGSVAVSWSYGVNQSGVVSSQVFEAVVAQSLPGTPLVTRVTPGIASASVAWSSPSTPAIVLGYVVEWGLEGLLNSNLTAGPSTTSALLAPLMAFGHYAVGVAAYNDVGIGPLSPIVPFTLTAWTIVAGSVSPADARVTVDGVPVGVAGGSFSLNTTYAPHLVSAIATDHGPAALALTAVWNATAWANFTLLLLPATVEGFLTPVTADLTWDGNSLPVSGDGFFAVSSPAGGPHAIAATYPGLLPFAASITVSANSSVWLNISLRETNGTLNLSISPANAVATLNGTVVSLDANGQANLSLSAGRYPYRVTLPLFAPVSGNVTIRSGIVSNLSIALVPLSNDSSGGGGAGSSNWFSDPLLLGLVVAVALVLVAVAVLAARRGRRPPEDPDVETVVTEPVTEPPTGSPEAPDPGADPAT
jgi:hypothetical protein